MKGHISEKSRKEVLQSSCGLLVLSYQIKGHRNLFSFYSFFMLQWSYLHVGPRTTRLCWTVTPHFLISRITSLSLEIIAYTITKVFKKGYILSLWQILFISIYNFLRIHVYWNSGFTVCCYSQRKNDFHVVPYFVRKQKLSD